MQHPELVADVAGSERRTKIMNNFLSWLKTVKWKNGRAGPNTAYIPTTIEHCANVLTHGVWIVPSLLACHKLIERCQTSTQYLAAGLYGTSLILLFSVSTFFHSVFYCSETGNLKDILHRCDRAVIYIFIAGSYFPWAMLLEFPPDSMSANACWLVWVMAMCGISYQQMFHERFKMLETFIYCCTGIIPSILLAYECKNLKGLSQLCVGGVLYLLGVIFFKADGRIPCAHAIWHCFVAAAALVHYIAISYHLFPNPDATLNAAFSYLQKIEL